MKGAEHYCVKQTSPCGDIGINEKYRVFQKELYNFESI
jgi:hypothetical protein